MCVIIVKPYGIELPSKELLQKCWTENPHGAGFSVTRSGATMSSVEKGFLTFKHFYHFLTRYVTSKDDLVVMHFRWATHGYMSSGHTHPFPVSRYRSELEKLIYKTNIVVFHNGVIRMKRQPFNWSDTMFYIGGILAHMPTLDVQKIAEQTKGSRLCIVNDGIPTLIGEGWKEDDGCMYSNLDWKESKRKLIYYTGCKSAVTEMSEKEWDDFVKKHSINNSKYEN